MSMKGDTYREAVATITRLAADAFKDHVITSEGDGRWRCAKPGTGVYSFRVISAPGHIIVFGDVGDGIARGSDRDMVPLVRGTCGRKEGVDRDYVISKLQTEEPRRFYPGDAIAYLAERVRAGCGGQQVRDWLRHARAAHRDLGLDEPHWHELVDEFGGDGEDHDVGFSHDSGALWFVECLRCFIRLHDAQVKPEAVASVTE